MKSNTPVLQPGIRLKGGTYEILSLLGQGGFGEVYLARQTRVQRDVAIKVLLPHVSANESMVMRFQGEALAAGKLDHPNVLTVFDFDYEEALGVWFLALQYIPGGRTLRSVLGAPLPLGEVIHYVEAIAGALDAAHARNIVHRDVKPENVLLRVDDHSGVIRPLLTDFGLARLRTSGVHTATGLIMGTLEYMAPEQGRGKEIGPASDQYALGVMAYEMLGGRRPFVGDQMSLLLAHANETPPPLTALNPLVNAATRAAVLLALSKAPEERFTTCAEFAQALRLASGWETSSPIGSPTPLKPPSPVQKPPHAERDLELPSPRPPTTPMLPPRLAEATPVPTTAHTLAERIDGGLTPAPAEEERPLVAEQTPGTTPADDRVSLVTQLDAVDADRIRSGPTPLPRTALVEAEDLPSSLEPKKTSVALEIPPPAQESDESKRESKAAMAPRATPVPIASTATKLADAAPVEERTGSRPRVGLFARLVAATLAVLLVAGAGVALARVAPPPVPTPPAASGSFSVESDPPADVLLDGAVVGRTPLELPLVAGSSHQIILHAESYRDHVWPVQVEGGVRRQLVVTLAPLPAAELLVPSDDPEFAPLIGRTLYKDGRFNRLQEKTDRFLRSDGVATVVYLKNQAFGVRDLSYTAIARWYVAGSEAAGQPWREVVEQHRVPSNSQIWDPAFCMPAPNVDFAGTATPLRVEFLIDGTVVSVLPFTVQGGDPTAFARGKCEIAAASSPIGRMHGGRYWEGLCWSMR
jgi:serine/threonine protein kinase